MKHLEKVLQFLQQHQLYVNQKKCSFGQRELEYLGHIVTGNGVAANPKKVVTMVDWPIPKDLKSLRGFLGLTGYYRHFVQNYGKIALPLTNLLKKDSFLWNKEAQDSFENLKTAMVQIPVLAIPNFDKPFVIEPDAFEKGVGDVLSQEERLWPS